MKKPEQREIIRNKKNKRLFIFLLFLTAAHPVAGGYYTSVQCSRSDRSVLFLILSGICVDLLFFLSLLGLFVVVFLFQSMQRDEVLRIGGHKLGVSVLFYS
ncbi:hypothetical protein BO82DRAFT_29059 [Aspergillus uvarum CBS 121591]|uniref:Uncharacterized protein n=1 Tax=Aspergillus uvarum CBS 121591 TaxID=1448315 RepID=A0A319CFB4_9EURO|nr:hypothetical protein BO82DRAFT_29059 [Aspergillus uvarum CBS 121591]PYH83934.1 hypothetical protein BO82DRAFT_29059 [Aspergillus uvarum CBS 121591]